MRKNPCAISKNRGKLSDFKKNWNRIEQKWENCVQNITKIGTKSNRNGKTVFKQRKLKIKLCTFSNKKRKICPILTTLWKKQSPMSGSKKLTKNRQMLTKLKQNVTKYGTFWTEVSYASAPLHTRPRTGGVPSPDHSPCPPVVYDCDDSKLIIQ